MPWVTSSHELQAEFLRIALEDAPATAVQFLTDDMTAPDERRRPDPGRPRAQRRRADRRRGRAVDGCRPGEEESRELVLGAFSVRWWRAPRGDDATLRPEANALNDHLHLAGPASSAAKTIPALAATHPLTAFELLELTSQRRRPATGALFLLAGELALTGDYTRAEARWTARSASQEPTRSPSAYAAASAQGDLTRAARSLSPRRLGRRRRAVSQGRPQTPRAINKTPPMLAHDARDLRTAGHGRLGGPTDPALMTARLELISGLHEPRLSALTLPRAEALLRADPSKNTHRLLVARASADAGLGADAATQHRGLFARGERTPVLLREVAYASAAAGYESTPAIDARITAGITEGTLGGSPLTVAYAADRIVSIFEAGGFAEQANAARLSQWLATPTARPWEPADLQLITTGHR